MDKPTTRQQEDKEPIFEVPLVLAIRGLKTEIPINAVIEYYYGHLAEYGKEPSRIHLKLKVFDGTLLGVPIIWSMEKGMTNPTSRQQVLDASDEQLNEWAATVVMGWRKAVNKYAGGDFWESNLGAMILVDKYIPVSDIAQAMGMVKTFGPEWSIEISRKQWGKTWHCSMDEPCEDDWTLSSTWAEDYVLSRAITQACILAKLEV